MLETLCREDAFPREQSLVEWGRAWYDTAIDRETADCNTEIASTSDEAIVRLLHDLLAA